MSYTQLLYHIVFRTKHSRPVIYTEHEEHIYRYMWGIVKEKGGVLHRIGGMPDHIHLLVQLPTLISLADFMRDLKTSSSLFVREHKEWFPHFDGWARAYCAVTHNYADKNRVINYIKNQKEHHKRTSFKEELIAFLSENGMIEGAEYFLKD